MAAVSDFKTAAQPKTSKFRAPGNARALPWAGMKQAFGLLWTGVEHMPSKAEEREKFFGGRYPGSGWTTRNPPQMDTG